MQSMNKANLHADIMRKCVWKEWWTNSPIIHAKILCQKEMLDPARRHFVPDSYLLRRYEPIRITSSRAAITEQHGSANLAAVTLLFY